MKLAGAYINDEKYAAIVAVAESNNRTLAGQLRHWFEEGLKAEIKPMVPPSARIAKVITKNPSKKGRA